MNVFQRYKFFLAIISLLPMTLMAGEVTTDFNDGDVLTATKITEIKDATNDNNTRIGVLESSEKITNVNGGSGLVGGGSSGEVTLSINPSQVQTRVTGTCPEGESIRAIAENGTVTCEVDDNIVDSLKIIDGTIVADDIDNTSVQQRLNSGCSPGSSIRDISADGTPACEIDDDTTYTPGNGIDINGNEIRQGAGSASISHHAFHMASTYAGCSIIHMGNYAYFNAGKDCGALDAVDVYAPIQLPDGVMITGFTCNVLDNTADGEIREVSMHANYVESAAINWILIGDSGGIDPGSTGSSGIVGVSPGRQKIGDTVIVKRVDNYNEAYQLVIRLAHSDSTTFADTANDLHFAGCRVTYVP